jgi:peptide/nickel transport system permease protein
MVMVLKARFVETARAKGLPPIRVRYAHAARNALLPLVTRFGLRLAFLVTGVLVVETIYSYPGLGTLLFNAIGKRDLPVIPMARPGHQ